MDINKTHLKILQWNCRSVSNKLILHNEAKNFDIIVLIETWLNEIKHLKLKGFNIVRFDRQSGSGGGIAICIKQNIFYEGTTINFSSKSLETGSVIIKLHSEKLLITTCYRPEYIGDTLNNLTANTWNNLTKAVLDHGTEYFILCGDFNAHHPMWGSDKSCSNGLIIAENTDPEEFILLNDRSPTHYTLSYSGFSESCIDLFFCSSNIFYKSSWYVVDDSWKNDHYPIVLEINVKPIYQQRIYYRHNLKKLNWENFYDILEKNRALFTGLNCINQGIESRYKTFIEFLNEAITNSLPNVKNGIVESKIKLKTQNSKSTTKAKCIWWNEKCEKSFCNKITPKTRINEFWRTVKRFNNSLKELDSSSTNTKLENNMQEAIIKLCSPKSLTTDILINLDNMEVDTDNTPDCEVLNKLFSYEELQYALNNINLDSSPGLDKISYEIIYNLPEFYQRILLDLFNDIYNSQYFPPDWNNYLVIFIPKGTSSKVRPISLASCSLKLFEKLIKEKLQWWLEKHDILSNTQFGFRKNKSCIDNLSILTTDIQKNFYTKDTVSADSVVPDILIDDLIALKLPKKIISFIKNIIYERNVSFCTLTEIIQKKVDKGLPQGSVLSPLLYSIYTRKVDKIISKPILILQFADDIVIYNSNPSTCEDQISQLEKENSKLLLHLKDRGLEVAPEKCVLVIFDKSKQAKKIPIKVNDLVVEPSEKTRFLGMIMDRQLNWNHHSTNLVNKCKYSLRILSFLRLTRWGANPEFLITLYKALIRPKMEYGCFLMFPSDMKIIDKLQKKLVLNNLETLTELSENFRFSHNYSPSLMMECYSKTWFLRDSIINSNKHIKYTNNFMHNFFKPNINLENGRKLLKCSSPQSLFIEMFPENNQNSIYIFTDGSKMSDNDNHSYVGMAAWSSTLDYCFSYKISDSASIFTAECSALIFTIDKIIEKRVGNYIIFSDSESALKALNSFSSESPLIYMIRHKLQLASQYNININLVWIPSHVGIQGNDNVDLLAKTAAKNGPFLDIPIPASDLVSGFKHECNEENEQVCLDLSNSKGSFYFDNFYTKKQKPWFAELGLSRKAIVSMNRIRCNHSSLNTSLFRKSIVHETTCVCGKNDDTIKHLFWECELHEEHRKTLLDNLKLSGINDPHTVIPLLASKNKNVIFSISKFLYDTKIKV
uniref:Reverse transcriptase domain-containing protein n=1 Tax=Trichogramma kaykai TaxID=54128 RepID=A0ABD2WKN0_9HYME